MAGADDYVVKPLLSMSIGAPESPSRRSPGRLKPSAGPADDFSVETGPTVTTDSEMDAFDAAAGERVLIVDDDPFIGRLLEIELRAVGYDVRSVSDGVEALETVGEWLPDLVLADVMMPNMDGFELTRHLRQDSRTATVSVIMLTARGLSADKIEGFSVGADDYVVKPFDTPELLARIRGVLRRAKEMRAQSPLTGLPGNIRIEGEIEARVKAGDLFAILYVDLDHFKSFNDHYGFMRGDQVIRWTACLLQDVALDLGGVSTFVGHVGGDDFVVVCSADVAERIAEEAIARFDRSAADQYDEADRALGYIEVTNRRGEIQKFPFVSMSIGIASSARRSFSHYAEAVAVATEMKSFTKGTAGSSWAIDRRIA